MSLTKWIGLAAFWACFFLSIWASASEAPTRQNVPAASSSVTPSSLHSISPSVFVSPAPVLSSLPEVSPSPLLSPVPQLAKLTANELKRLSREFGRAQDNEIEAFKHRQKLELKELAASQRVYLKEWNQREVAGAKEFYRSHKGSAVREYMIDIKTRRKALEKMQDEEKRRRQQEYDSRLKAMKEDHEVKLREFKTVLSRGEKPPAILWPRNNF